MSENVRYRCEQILVGITGLLAISLVLFSDFMAMSMGGYAGQRFALVFTLGFLGLISMVSYAVRWRIDPGVALVASIPTFMLCAAYVTLSFGYVDHSYALVEPGMYGFFFLSTFTTGAMLTWTLSGLDYSRFLLVVIATSSILYGLASINVYIFSLLDGLTNLVDFIPWGFVNIRYWSHIATWFLPLIPLAVLVGPFKDNRLWKILVLLGAGLWWWILLLTTGRGSALGIVFGGLLAVCLFGRLAFPWLRVFLKYLLAGIVIWLILSIAIPSFMSEGVQVRNINTGSASRMPLFVEAWVMSLENFPFGMGPQAWLTHEILTEEYANNKRLGHPHNMYLMWAAEYGWLLIAALGLVVAQAIGFFWQKRQQVISMRSREQATLLTGFTASVSAALFHGGVSAVFMAPGSMLVGTFVLIAFWSLIIPFPNSVPGLSQLREIPSIGTRAAIAILLGALVLAVWLLWVKEVSIYYQDMRQDEEHYYEQGGGGILPRFWFHGNFPRAPGAD